MGETTAAPGGHRSHPDRRTRAGTSFEVVESKLHPPWVRPGIVARTALVERLLATPATPVICVVGPAGYGKTTLLAQWAQRSGRRVAWVSVDRHDNDPAVLLSYLTVALDHIAPVDPGIFQTLASPGAHLTATVVPRLAGAISRMAEPVALVLDHVELLHDRACLDLVAELAVQLPSGSQLALASRTRPRLPLALLRTQGRVVELGASDLAMDQFEARALLEGAQVRLADNLIAELHRRTEGWPVGLYLAALALQAGAGSGTEADAGVTFAGDDRLVADYLWFELLSRLPARQVSFLTRTAVLDRMCGPLCDAVLGASGSGRLLASLAESNLLLVPLDRRRDWYRYHHLFRDLLRAELQRREPKLVPRLHLRAAAWCEANGLQQVAIDHAQAAGDADRVARLVLETMQPVWASGRVDTVLRWMEWFDNQQLVERYPAVAVHGALIFALLGRPGSAERWAAAAERASPQGRLADGSTMESYLAYLRAILCRAGVDQMRRDARAGWDGLSPPPAPTARPCCTPRASPICSRATPTRPTRSLPAPTTPPARRVRAAGRRRAGRALHPRRRPRRLGEAAALADRALAIVRSGEFDAYWTSALVYAWAARVAVHRGDLGAAREHLTRAARRRPLLTYALPVVSVQALLELARAYIALADPHGARAVLGQADGILQQRPDLGVLGQQADQLRAQVDTLHADVLGASSLTTAELRLLPLLSTHLSFRQIGERLYLSPHTVKSQAMSIYHKLGASSRSQAVQRTQQLGLLTG